MNQIDPMDEYYKRTATATSIPMALIFDPTLSAEQKVILMILYSCGTGVLPMDILSEASGVEIERLRALLMEMDDMNLFSFKHSEQGVKELCRVKLEERYHHLPLSDKSPDAYSPFFYTKRFEDFKYLMRGFNPESAKLDLLNDGGAYVR